MSVIQLPPNVIIEEINGLGLKQKTKVYVFTQLNKRDSYIIVAQLSPEFTARLVDRWQELENSNSLAADLAERWMGIVFFLQRPGLTSQQQTATERQRGTHKSKRPPRRVA